MRAVEVTGFGGPEVLTLAAEGPLHPVIGAPYPLERTAEAHRAIEDRTVLGKVLLTTAPGGSDSHPPSATGASGPSAPSVR
jgi:hypothetical protein